MRFFLITVIMLFQFLSEERIKVHGLPQGSSTDPCEAAPCGTGADCKPMGSIAICICPNDGKGDPFVNCMEEGTDENANDPDRVSPELSPSSPSLDSNQFVASFDVASVHHPNSKPTPISTSSTTTRPSTTRTTTSYPTKIITGSTTSRSTTTRSPFVHVFETSSYRPPSENQEGSSQNHGESYDLYEHNRNRDRNQNNQPESHRIPILDNSRNNGNYPHHNYPPRPINGDSISTSSPSYSTYHHGGTGTTYDIFNEKTVGADYGGGVTSSYPYRGSSSTGHLSGTHHAYEYDSRPMVPRPTPTSSNYGDRFAHHGHHPTSSGFPGPITESSHYSGYAPKSPMGSGSSYDIYNFNSVRNEISSNDYGFTRVNDPLGKYENCRLVSGIVLCADNSNRYPPHNREQDYAYHGSSSPAYNFPLRGEVTTNNYGFHTDRDRYSSYYPNRYSSTSSRPMFNNNNYDHRQGYPQHGPREPIDSDHHRRHPYVPKEQHVSAQNMLTITSSSSMPTTTARNDNDHPLCKSMCGVNSICRLHMDRPVCGCPEGHTGDPSVSCSPVKEFNGDGGRGARKDGECERHVDCKSSEICAKEKCIDPCTDPEGFSSSSVTVGGSKRAGSSICGTNASCLVIMRTPVCKCESGFTGNPYVACSR